MFNPQKMSKITLMPFLPPSIVGRSSRALQSESAANLHMSIVTFQWGVVWCGKKAILCHAAPVAQQVKILTDQSKEKEDTYATKINFSLSACFPLRSG